MQCREQVAVLGKSTAHRLKAQVEPGFVTGWDLMSEEETRKREERAKKYGTEVVDYAKASLQVAGLTKEESSALDAARERCVCPTAHLRSPPPYSD